MNFLKFILILAIIQLSYSATNRLDFSELDSCPCDLVISECDPFCCCDNSCATSLVKSWTDNQECVNKKYPSLLTIPYCEDNYSYNIQDLYRSFRVAYNLFRNLMCVSSDNLSHDKLEPTFTNVKMTGSEEKKSLQILENLKSGSIIGSQQRSTTVYKTKEDILASKIVKVGASSDQDLKVFVKAQRGNKCVEQFVYKHSQVKGEYCTYTTTVGDFGGVVPDQFNVAYYKGLGGTTTVEKIHLVSDSNVVTLSSDSNSSINTSTITLNSPGAGQATITNLVRQAHFIVSMNYESANRNDILKIQIILYVQANAVVGMNDSLKIAQSVRFESRTELGEVVPNDTAEAEQNAQTIQDSIYGYSTSGRYGYLTGSPLKLGNSATTNEIKPLQNPLLIGYMNENGECLKQTTGIDISHQTEIQFGYDTMLSCKLPQDQTLDCDYNLVEFFKEELFIGKYGDSSPNYLLDWIQIDSQDTAKCDNNYPVLTISYSQYGKKTNTVNVINNVNVSYITSTDPKQIKAFIIFKEIKHNSSFFQASLPRVRIYLPNDILYPFYVAGS